MQRGILSIDIGGSGLKADVVDDAGNLLTGRVRVPTPKPSPPDVVVDAIVALVQDLPAFDRISIGFPGVVKDGKVLTAVNLGGAIWLGYPLAQVLSQRLGGFPARLINDADMQGYALVSGVGLELVITLGTGIGSALFRDGQLMPHMEFGHHPFRGDETYEEQMGEAALRRIGQVQWQRRVQRMLVVLDNLLHPDRIYLGGGNARLLDAPLAANVIIGSNEAGVKGGAALWRDPAHAPSSSG